MINKFLAGKKKYSVFIATLLVSAVQMFVSDPGQQQELQELVPMVAMVLSGIVYLVVEGIYDINREKATAAYYNAQNPPYATAAPQQDAQPATAEATEPPAEPFDVASFHKGVMSSVGAKYGEVNPATVYYQARDRGAVTRCSHINQALDYWDYLCSLAYEAQEYLRQQTETQTGACQPRDAAYYAMQRDVKHTLQSRDNLEALAESGVDWKKALPYATLHGLAELAPELLGI